MPTDYTTACGYLPLSFIQMLANCIVGYYDIAGVLHYRINGLEYNADCDQLSDFLDCDLSHIDPERQLVENTFALDDCGRLAWKLFHSDNPTWEDYEECGEIPQTLIQMLARCIVTYAGGNKINALIDTGDCTELTALLTCVTNNIESERLLVANSFAVDDCERLLLKLFANTSTMTDYHTECTEYPLSFYQLLAMCLAYYNSAVHINTASVTGYCGDLVDFWTCSNNHIDPERALVENVFAMDDCDILALKIFNNAGEEERQ